MSLKSLAKSSERTGPRSPEAWDPRDVQHSGIETTQKEYYEIQEMKNKYVHLKHPMVQQRIRKLREWQFMNKRLVPQGTQNSPQMKNYKGKWLGKPSTQQEWILLTWEKWQQGGQPKS